MRALGDGDAARAEETLARLTRGCDECARRAVLPKRRDEVVDAWRRVAACGDAFERAMRPECAEAVLEMTEDGARALETAKRNADAATACFEAVACVYGVENGDERARRGDARESRGERGAERFHREIAHHRHGGRERVVAR